MDVVAAEGASREVSAAPATAVTVMPTADGEDTADQLPMVVTVAGTAVTEADMAATAAASGEGMAPAEPEARRGEVHEEARAVEREEQAPVGEGREPSPIKHRSAIELCKTKEQSLQKQKLNLQSQYTKNTNLLNFLLTS